MSLKFNTFLLVYSHKSYRPLTILTFRLENHLYGLNPFYMKVVNLILHSICSCLVYFVSKAIFSDDAVSFYASVVFAVHPIHTEVKYDHETFIQILLFFNEPLKFVAGRFGNRWTCGITLMPSVFDLFMAVR